MSGNCGGNSNVSGVATVSAPTSEAVDICDNAKPIQFCNELSLSAETIDALKSKTTVVDNGDGTATITNEDGSTVIVSTNDTVVTYEWSETNPVDGDGIVEWTGTPSDGSAAQVISVAEPTVDTDTDTVFTGSTLDPVTGIVTQTFEDADGNALASKSLDLSALISSEHPALAAGTGVQVAFDAAANVWTVSNTVTDTNTFATLAGGVLTLPDGQTYDLTDTNTFATLSGNVLTLPSGQTYDLTKTVDTNTFATLAGTVITFPDGSTIDAGVDTFATLSGSVLTLAGGQTYDLAHTVDTDTSVTVVNNADGSQSLQNVDINGNNVGVPVVISTPHIELESYKQSAPNTIVEVAAGTGKAIDFGSTAFLTTNGATEAGAAGVRNSDGKLGFNWTYLTHSITNDGLVMPNLVDNGVHYRLGVRGELSGQALQIPKPARAGNVLKISVPIDSSEAFDVILTSGAGLSMRGIRRDASNNKVSTATSIFNTTAVRSGESVTLMAVSNSVWVVTDHQINLLGGSNWNENENGLVTGWGNLPYNPAVFPAFTTAFTHIVEGVNGTFTAHGARY